MPKERIFTEYPQDPADPSFRPFQMDVAWNKDMDMQVGIATHDDRHLVDYIYADEQVQIGRLLFKRLVEALDIPPRDFRTSEAEAEFMNALGREALDAVTGSTPFGTSVWWTPTRHQVNMLIRLLRRARDAAFGRDE
jgi:hypothetical protein